MDWPANAVFDFPLWSIPAAQQIGTLWVASVLALLSLLYAAWMTRRLRDPFPLALFLGAACSVVYEPLGDILTKVAYPPLDQISLMTAFGRPVPLWMLPNYAFFFCVPVLLLLHYVVRPDVTARRWWLSYAGIALFVALFEQPGINADNWRYYATNQALSINSYPLWVAFANAQSLFMIATGIALLRRRVITPRLSFLFVPIVPMLFVGSHVGAALPISAALYSTDNRLIVNAAALLAILMCLLTVWIAGRLVRGDGAAQAGDAQAVR